MWDRALEARRHYSISVVPQTIHGLMHCMCVVLSLILIIESIPVG